MNAYQIETTTVFVGGVTTTLLKGSFGAPAGGDEIAKTVAARMAELENEHGQLALWNGPATVVASFAVGHVLAHRFGAVGVYDPKLLGYVVAVSHDPERPVGDIIPESAVTSG